MSHIDAQWAAVRAALQSHDMPAVVALLHPLAVSDPRGVEVFMAALATEYRDRGGQRGTKDSVAEAVSSDDQPT